MSDPEPETRPSREDIETELAAILATQEWLDVTASHGLVFDEGETPRRVLAFASARSKLRTVYLLLEWQDKTHTLIATSDRHPGEFRKPFGEPFKDDWLWEHAVQNVLPPDEEPAASESPA